MLSSRVPDARSRRRILIAAITSLGVAAGISAALATAASGPTWSMSGQGIANWRFQPSESQINASNAGALKVAWKATLGGDISSTPAVVDGVAYVTDWGGKLSAVDTSSGSVIWQESVGQFAGASGALVEDVATQTVVLDTANPVVSRTSPAVSGDTVVIGTQTMRAASGDGARLIAVDRRTGGVLWVTRLDSHPAWPRSRRTAWTAARPAPPPATSGAA